MNYVEIYASATNQRWADGLHLIPEHMVDGLVRYIVQGVPPGSFLTAVLSGDLFEALRRADDINQSALVGYARFLTNYAPIGSYGSPGSVTEWIKSGGIDGMNNRPETSTKGKV